MERQFVSVASTPAAGAPGALAARIAQEIEAAGGWLGFERYMELALYAPGLGYYARGDRQFGHLPSSGSDFVTAPELTPRFGRTLARQLGQALDATGTDTLWEFGAGSGALAASVLEALGERVRRYTIVDLSGALRARQRDTLAARVPQGLERVQWADALPEAIDGVVIGNELLDALPVALLHFDGARWRERGVVREGAGFAFAERDTGLRPPEDAAQVAAPGRVVELPRQADGFMRTLGATLRRGAAFFLDYGFPAAELHHPQRYGGTLMCHRGHRSDPDPLTDVGEKDITAHVDFTAVALAGQEAGLAVLGYTTQAHFLLNCGLLEDVPRTPDGRVDAREAAALQTLLAEHEMGELFKVIGFAAGAPFEAIGFARGDRSHRL